VDWVMERITIPKGEWEDLLEAMKRDHEADPNSFVGLEDRLIQLLSPEAKEPLVVAREMVARIIHTLYGSGKSVRVQSLAGVPLPEAHRPPEGEREEGNALDDLIWQWLQFYGPVTIDFIRKTLGIESERLQLIMEDLLDSQKIIQGQLVTDGAPEEVCDSENFERLLRLIRVEAAPAFEPLGIEWLPLFFADYQGITKPRDGIDGLYRSMEQLLCYPAEAQTWESEIFPARLHPYDPSWLDTMMQEGEVLWIGSEGHRVTFCFESDLDLLQEETEEAELELDEEDPIRSISGSSPVLPADLFPDLAGRYDFSTLLRLSESKSEELAKRLWEEVWKGKVTNDTFISLRRALMNRFRIPVRGSDHLTKLHRSESRLRRLSLAERKEGPFYQFYPGNWYTVPRPDLSNDLLETEERRKDRARLLLDRYGILFRELLQREWPTLRWSNVFRALRIMELSGEVMAGMFFHGIPGPQFISHRAFRHLQRKVPEDVIFWINATDPASLCGIQLDSVRGMLPARVATTHLVYQGNKLIVVSKRNGKDLTFNVPADDPRLPEYMGSLRHLLTRKFQPIKRVSIETINGEKATQSPYLPSLRTSFEVAVDYKNVTLYRKMR
jgi:ATP-dependent Lhr-like helicase